MGIASAEASIKVTGAVTAPIDRRAMAINRGAGSTASTSRGSPIEREVQARSDPDLEHSPLGHADDPLAIRQQTAVTHREIAESRQNDVTVEAHELPLWHRRFARSRWQTCGELGRSSLCCRCGPNCSTV